MSKILDWKEANAIATKMVAQYGFTPVEVCWDDNADIAQKCRVCNLTEKIETVGFWPFRFKEKKIVKNVISATLAPTIEDCLVQLEQLLKGSCGQGRVDKADALRKSYADILLDEELRKDG